MSLMYEVPQSIWRRTPAINRGQNAPVSEIRPGVIRSNLLARPGSDGPTFLLLPVRSIPVRPQNEVPTEAVDTPHVATNSAISTPALPPIDLASRRTQIPQREATPSNRPDMQPLFNSTLDLTDRNLPFVGESSMNQLHARIAGLRGEAIYEELATRYERDYFLKRQEWIRATYEPNDTKYVAAHILIARDALRQAKLLDLIGFRTTVIKHLREALGEQTTLNMIGKIDAQIAEEIASQAEAARTISSSDVTVVTLDESTGNIRQLPQDTPLRQEESAPVLTAENLLNRDLRIADEQSINEHHRSIDDLRQTDPNAWESQTALAELNRFRHLIDWVEGNETEVGEERNNLLREVAQDALAHTVLLAAEKVGMLNHDILTTLAKVYGEELATDMFAEMKAAAYLDEIGFGNTRKIKPTPHLRVVYRREDVHANKKGLADDIPSPF